MASKSSGKPEEEAGKRGKKRKQSGEAKGHRKMSEMKSRLGKREKKTRRAGISVSRQKWGRQAGTTEKFLAGLNGRNKEKLGKKGRTLCRGGGQQDQVTKVKREKKNCC